MGGRGASSGRNSGGTARAVTSGVSISSRNASKLTSARNNNSVLGNVKTNEISGVNKNTVHFKGSSKNWTANSTGDTISVSQGNREWTIYRNPDSAGKKWVVRESSTGGIGGRTQRIGESDSVDTLINKVNKKMNR